MEIFDPMVSYGAIDDINAMSLVEMVRHGVEYSTFDALVAKSPFSINEWSVFLHLSERTLQRYKIEMRKFDTLQSEKIIEMALLFQKGLEVFGDVKKFNNWLFADNLALGKVKPKELLDSCFGIDLIKDELMRIETGVLA